LRYAQFAIRFTEHTTDDEETHGVDGGPTGGFTWDGRADTAREQALMPLFDEREMANADEAALARRVAAAPYAAQFRQAFSAPGRDVFADPKQAVAWMALAFEVFEQGREFAPFDSRYDRFLAGRATPVARGAARARAVPRSRKGNCDTCHPSRRSSSGRAPLFTDAGFIAVAAPRRADLPPLAASARSIRSPRRRAAPRPTWGCAARAARAHRRSELLRALSHADAAQRGAARELLPQRLGAGRCATRSRSTPRATPIPRAGIRRTRTAACASTTTCRAGMAPFVNHEVPFEPRPDGKPRLDDRDIDDIVAFLRTLTDADAEASAIAVTGHAAR
jgi:cytochrome c peroxidase